MKKETLKTLYSGILPKFKEALFAILPMSLLMVVVPFLIPDMSLQSDGSKFGPIMVSLLISVIPLVLGTTLFNMGVEMSIGRIGSIVGTTLTKRRSIFLLLFIALLMGFLTTLAEPDLSVLASRISKNGPDWSLIAIAAVGVGIFLVMSILRVIYNKPLKYWLAIGYGLVFTLGLFADPTFFSIVFDAGGVTTGVVTVPFILGISVSVARVLGGDNAEDDSFGYSGLCSLGTVLSVMVFSIVLKNAGRIDAIQDILSAKVHSTDPAIRMFPEVETYAEIGSMYLSNFLSSLKDVAISMLPIVVFFLIYNLFLKLNRRDLTTILFGLLYTFFGLILFLMGAESGFIPMASGYGRWFARSGNLGLFFGIGFLLGAISMLAEPSVKVLAENVSEVSRGVISKAMIYAALCLSTSVAIVLNIYRVEYGISILYFIVPLFLIALVLAFLTPEIYVGIAVDAAGVATGTMAACFFLPMFVTYVSYRYDGSSDFGKDVMANGFGIVGIMSVIPIIAVEVLGIFSVVKVSLRRSQALKKAMEPDDNQVIHLPVGI
jgi:hypothetical protein